MVVAWVIIGVLVLVGVIFFVYFNRFAVLGNRIDNSLSQIDVQLKRRADLVPNLIETVKGFAKHEKEAIKAVTDARKALVSAKGIEKKVAADKNLETALKTVFAVAEGYPDLKADTNFLELQKELSSTEDRVAYARQYYNDSIMSYNNSIEVIPGKLFASLYNFKKENYFEIPEEEKINQVIEF